MRQHDRADQLAGRDLHVRKENHEQMGGHAKRNHTFGLLSRISITPESLDLGLQGLQALR